MAAPLNQKVIVVIAAAFNKNSSNHVIQCNACLYYPLNILMSNEKASSQALLKNVHVFLSCEKIITFVY